MKIRIQFTKKGPVKYMGHLDTMRFFQRALRRAGFDLSYSKGFSPHPIMNFAAPLGVGIESGSEVFDVEVESLEDRQLMIESLNQTLCDGMSIRDIRLLPEKTPNAMASVKAAKYSVRFFSDYDPGIDIDETVKELLLQNEVLITKKTKKNELTVDIRPGIYELIYDNGEIIMLIDASSGSNIRPEQVVGAMLSLHNIELPENSIHITRLEVYSTDDEGGFLPLIEFGDVF